VRIRIHLIARKYNRARMDSAMCGNRHRAFQIGFKGFKRLSGFQQ